MNADGSDVVRITPDSSWHDSFPRWSPDGRKIAFLSNRLQPGRFWTIYIMDADGTDVAALPRPSSVRHITWFDWSPDGSRIAFSHAERTLREHLSIMDVAGSPDFVSLIDGDDYSDAYPIWSPDGRQLAFSTNRGDRVDGVADVYLMGISGAGIQNLTRNPAIDLVSSWKRSR